MKEQLAYKVDWFHSKNSIEYITTCEFRATDATIETIKNKISRFCDGLALVEVHLNEFLSMP
jgi:hypothetical protein